MAYVKNSYIRYVESKLKCDTAFKLCCLHTQVVCLIAFFVFQCHTRFAKRYRGSKSLFPEQDIGLAKVEFSLPFIWRFPLCVYRCIYTYT